MVGTEPEAIERKEQKSDEARDSVEGADRQTKARSSLAGPLASIVVQRKLQRRRLQRQSSPAEGVGVGAAAGAIQGMETALRQTAYTQWSKTEIMAVQRHLARLGLYTMAVDGSLGKGTEAGLVEAFGGDEWRGMDASTVESRLANAKTPARKSGDRAGDHRLRYGEMFKDGVLDLTVGVGFDEGEHHVAAIEAFREVLTQRGLALTNPAALTALYTKAGRQLEGTFGDFFVKKDALAYTPPAGDARKVSIVVRLVANFESLDKKEAAEARKNNRPVPKGHGANQGTQAAAAMKEGMEESDVAYYSGHGRYGSGPDFDRNMKFQLKTQQGWQVINDYSELESALKKEGGTGKTAWQVFLERIAAGTLRVDLSNAGNLFLNPENQHSGEFGARVMYWCLNHHQVTKPSGGVEYASGGSAAMTGEQGRLADKDNRKYQIYVFDGYRTQDYSRSMRKTPGRDTRQTDMLTTRRTLNWGDEANTLGAFLDGIMGQFSAEQVIRNMDKEQSPEKQGGTWGGAYQGDGLADNPVVK